MTQQHNQSIPDSQKQYPFVEKRFNNGLRVGPSEWLMFFLGLLTASLIFFAFFSFNTTPGATPAAFTLRQFLRNDPDAQRASEEPVASLLGSGAAIPSAPVGRVMENGHYINLVYFNGRAFTPDMVIINSGESVRFINTSTLAMRVGSRPENVSSERYTALVQSHAEGQGAIYEVLFARPGIWSYENLATNEPRILGVVFVR